MRGLVLAGGKSRRFGSDKTQAVYQGESFLSRTVRILAELKLSPLVVTREGAFITRPDSEILWDSLPEKGPLGGIYTAMKKFPEDDFLVLTCDMPCLDGKTLVRLTEEYRKKPAPTFYHFENGPLEPFPGIYPSRLWRNVYGNIFSEKLSMRELILGIPEKNAVPFEGSPRELVNVNHLSDLRALES